MTQKKNAFDTISDFIDKNGAPDNANLASVDIGHNSFFELGLPATTINNGVEDEQVVTIDNDLLEDLDLNLDIKPPKVKVEKKPKVETLEDSEDDEEEEEEVIDLKDTLDKDKSYDDYSDFALIALQQVEAGKWNLETTEIPKDLDAVTLMEMYDAQEKASTERIREEALAQTGEYSNYIKFLMEGGNPQVIQDSINLEQLVSLDISDEDNQKTVLRAFFELKQMEDDVIDDTIEAILDKGKGPLKAQEAIDQINKYKDNILEAKAKELEENKKAQKKQYDDYVTSFTTVVKTGKIGGITIDKAKQQQLIDAMFKPTETIEVVNNQGKKEKTRVTKSSLLFKEVNSDPNKLAALTLWLLHGGDFQGLKEEIKVEKDDSLRELLKGRRTKTVVNTRQSNTSNAFEVLAQNALDRERKTMYYQ